MTVIVTPLLLTTCRGDLPPGPAPPETPKVDVVDVTPSSSTLLTGGTAQLTATPRDTNGNVVNHPVQWSSSNTSVATVNGSGLVAGQAAGAATISATSRGTVGTATVSVNNASAGPNVLAAAGNIASCGTTRDEATAALIDDIPGTVLALGDNVANGTAADYANCYAPSWGRHKARTYTSLGNHEYNTGTADASFDYFGDRAGPRGKGFFSFDLGDWHVIVLNTNIAMAAGSEQERWLKADLAATSRRCTLAVFHQPRFFSSRTVGYTSSGRPKPLWVDLYAANADLVLNGGSHFYERFAPQDPDGARDDARGIVQINAGTGGESVAAPTVIAPNSVKLGTAYGVLKVTLGPDGYAWEFVPSPGQSLSDSGTGNCH